MGFKVKTEDAVEKRELKGKVPGNVATWFEEQAKETGVPLLDVVGQALLFAYNSANRKPPVPRKKKSEKAEKGSAKD